MQTERLVSPSRQRVLQGSAIAACFLIGSVLVIGRTRVPVPRKGAPAHVVAAAGSTKHPTTTVAYGKLPLSFEINRGQTDSPVKFLARGSGYSLFLTGNEAVLALKKPSVRSLQPTVNAREAPVGARRDWKGTWAPAGVAPHLRFGAAALPELLPSLGASETSENEMKKPQDRWVRAALQFSAQRLADSGETSTVLRMRLVGASANAAITGVDELLAKSNYFIGNDPKKWRTNVTNYAKVKYQGVYPGIALLYDGSQRQLEYDFVVAPGADPQAIRLELVGTGLVPAQGHPQGVPLRVDPNGDLVIPTNVGDVRFHKPVVYQEEESEVRSPRSEVQDETRDSKLETGKSGHRHSSLATRQFVDGRYVLTASNRAGFEIAAYDKTKPLVIDPTLAYSTFLGGSGNGQDLGDAGSGIAVDASGNAYVSGSTTSPDFPTSSGSFQGTYAGAPCSVYPCADAFVSKLSADGSALVYSTYLGGRNNDSGSSIAVDATGNAYVAGGTSSSDFPITPGAFQATLGTATGKAFVTKLNADGSALVYSTYLGGSTLESVVGSGIAVDASGNAFITGSTNSSDFPTTPGAFQTTFGAGNGSAFISKLNADGTGLVYSTYLRGGDAGVIPPRGAGGFEAGQAIAVDVSGNAYVTGLTGSVNFPTTANAFQPTCTLTSLSFMSEPTCVSAFVTKLNPAGSALVYSTYLGPILANPLLSGLGVFGIAIDALGNAYITGATDCSFFPTTPGAFQTGCGNNSYSKRTAAFVTKLDADGSALVYSTYLGVGATQGGSAIAVDASGSAYVTGSTTACDFPTTPDAFQAALPGVCYSNQLKFPSSAFLTKLNAAGSSLVYSTYIIGGRPNRFAQGGTIGAGIAVDTSGNVYVTGGIYSSDFPTTQGAFQTAFGGSENAFVSKFSSTETANLPPVAKAGPDQTIECASPTGTTVTLDGSASSDPDGDQLTYQWKNAAGQVVGTTAIVQLTLPLGQSTFTLTVNDGRGGTASDQVVITVRDTTPPNLSFTLSPNVLWPPNNQFVAIAAALAATDVCDASPTVILVSITSNEPGVNQDVQGAAVGTDDRNFLLRAQRNGMGAGRVYTVRYRASDASGNSTVASGTVLVPHDQR